MQNFFVSSQQQGQANNEEEAYHTEALFYYYYLQQQQQQSGSLPLLLPNDMKAEVATTIPIPTMTTSQTESFIPTILSPVSLHSSNSPYIKQQSSFLFDNNNPFQPPQLSQQQQQQQQQQSQVFTPNHLLSLSPPTATTTQVFPKTLFGLSTPPFFDTLENDQDFDHSTGDNDDEMINCIQSNNNNSNDYPNHTINLEVKSFSDLQKALGLLLESDNRSIGQQHTRRRRGRPRRRKKEEEEKKALLMQEEWERQQRQQKEKQLPASIRNTVASTMFLDTLMDKAQKHWCCIGFKVAPVTLDVIRHWQQAPVSIIYCVASIALVTFMDHNATQGYVRDAAMEFYQHARQKLDDIVFDDEKDDKCIYDDMDDLDSHQQQQQAMTIQSYFCLSYTSNLLRLYEQQRTWGGLASVAIQLRTKDAETGCRPMDQAILLCWCRWYYIDAWMSLTLHRECLLPDTPPPFIMDTIQSARIDLYHEHNDLYQFAILTRFMRRYIQMMHSGNIEDSVTQGPSTAYHAITKELKQWYEGVQTQQQQQRLDYENTNNNNNNNINNSAVHLHLCYNAMRLVVLYQFLHPDRLQADDLTVMDGLETNLALLQALQQLASQGCDQSTYHHMFFAIHNTASRIYQYHTRHRTSKWQKLARQQLQMNLLLLKGTPAYANDVFKMRMYAEKIEQQFNHMDLYTPNYYRSTLSSIDHHLSSSSMENTTQSTDTTTIPTITPSRPVLPGMHVYKLHTSATIKKPRKQTKLKQPTKR
ncbi:uncharacterized protein BX664DRAFT_320092 [Halteromyces radiatus]|uniref:uncharacterized protein n=1 Tax=Halteromyces radiatus TaxID=101107 RepID=UPI002220950A|nr:uncharacterized protein BX664DRAFT_320092 [Halteromyces radiatus]KAI8098983.1 hypothetical protein BX664DRAFT_320092 [Halteromyces radiatus]